MRSLGLWKTGEVQFSTALIPTRDQPGTPFSSFPDTIMWFESQLVQEGSVEGACGALCERKMIDLGRAHVTRYAMREISSRMCPEGNAPCCTIRLVDVDGWDLIFVLGLSLKRYINVTVAASSRGAAPTTLML